MAKKKAFVVPLYATKPVTRVLSDDAIEVTVRPANVIDESTRLEYGFDNQENAPILQVMMAEIWITMTDCNIQVAGEGDELLFKPNMSWGDFVAAATALWRFAPNILNELHIIVREVNPQWGTSDDDPM